MPDYFLLCVTALLGLAVGSFLNVVIHRVPDGKSLVHPPSQCPRCDSPIRPWHNVPVLGWLMLRGKCADCDEPISVRYPLVEAGTGALFVAVTARFGLSWELPAYLYLAAIAVALTMIDFDRMRLPNKIVVPSYGVAIALLAPASILTGDPGALLRAAIAAVILFALYEFLAIFGLGGGDVKLAPLLGFYLGWLGWDAVAVGAFAGFLIGGLPATVLLLLRRAKRKDRIPFGPSMLAGALLAVFAATPLATWYLNLLLLPPA
ncbi:A24 family peptidase [Actinoplanes sichuanensis]|uniref:Prepilin peptidase n=1 Tax=Actinoplanes sichuanensis TaxID=512349 RepID=A0ABW4ADG9_9ACTN|nr:A24 family peptidase [Actinoplanes sichuanensis]BEL09706.1 A24 family peptidase [Actinoplanes sichuanensis]